MKSAKVTARLRLADEKELSGPSAKHDKSQSPPGGPFIVAEVDCYFEMEYDTAVPAEDSGIVFPVFEKSTPSAIITKFETWTDGIECRELEPLDVEVADPTGRSVVYDGFGWPSPAPKGELQKSRVRYTMLLPVRQNRARFMYVVRSGGTWAKPIGQETVTVEFPEPLRLSVIGNFKPASQENGRWTWLLKDVRPTDDVEAFVDVPTNRNPETAK
ncbi:MAG: hypothetical protein HZA50_05920 [Planctomycetes bacterium]|nr:hypothetical protein [Planctomycetota bacterium]